MEGIPVCSARSVPFAVGEGQLTASVVTIMGSSTTAVGQLGLALGEIGWGVSGGDELRFGTSAHLVSDCSPINACRAIERYIQGSQPDCPPSVPKLAVTAV